MTDAITHYEEHLARVYAWSLGGAEAALASAERWLATVPLPAPPARIIDLGAGFGAHAIPLARAGHHVVAVDTSAALLDELARLEEREVRAKVAGIERVHADLVVGLRARREAWDAILCLGDTLPHLRSPGEVEALLAEIARALAPAGVAVLAYRPRRALAPAERFLLVRADAERSLTVFLEPLDDTHQMTWDLIVEGGRLATSGYPKLRLDPAWIADRARAAGLAVTDAPGERGMVVQLLRRAS